MSSYFLHTLFDTSTRRGQTEVIGFALLLGIGVGSAAFMIAVGATPLEEIQGQTNEQQAKSGFSTMSSDVTTVGLSGRETSNKIDASFTQAGEDITVKGDSTVTVRSVDINGNSTQVIKNDMGYLEYETETGTTLYYENGGIWREYGNGNGYERITTPEFHYENQTVTFPIIQIIPVDDSVSNSFKATHIKTGRSTEQLFVDNQIIEIEITSPVYEGWGEYFEDEVSGANVEYDHEQNTVLIELGSRSKTLDSFTDAALSGGDITLDGNNASIEGDAGARGQIDGSGTITGNVTEDADYTLLSMDNTIDARIETADTYLNSLSGKTLTKGHYVVGDTSLKNDNLTVDLSSGDVTLAIDGNFNVTNGSTINVINPEGGKLETYVKEDFYMTRGGPSWTVEDGKSNKNIVYSSKDSEAHFGNQATFNGVLYAPSTESTTGQSGNSSTKRKGGGPNATGGCSTSGSAVCLATNSNVNGAIVAGSTTMRNNSTIDYDEENLSDFSFNVDLAEDENRRPELTFFHSSNTRIEISDD